MKNELRVEMNTSQLPIANADVTDVWTETR